MSKDTLTMTRDLFADYKRMYVHQGKSDKYTQILEALKKAYAENDDNKYSAGLDLALYVVEGLGNEFV